MDNRTYSEQAVDGNDFDKMIFNISNVPGDGNCFFHCLSLALNHNFTMSVICRQIICEHILKNQEDLCNNIELQDQTPFSYLQSMILGYKYAFSCEIEVAAKLFLRQINVWLECKNTDNIIWHVLTKFESGTLTHIRLL